MSAISTSTSVLCAAKAANRMIDYDGLPASKEYYGAIGTVITPEAWRALRGPGNRAHRVPEHTPRLIAERASAIFAAKTGNAKEKEAARLSIGAWIWYAHDDADEAAAVATAAAVTCGADYDFFRLYLLPTAVVQNGGELYGPNSKAHTVDRYRDLPVLVIADLGASGMREEALALIELLGDRRRHKRSTLFASTFTGKSIARALEAAGSNSDQVRKLIELISAGVREGRRS